MQNFWTWVLLVSHIHGAIRDKALQGFGKVWTILCAVWFGGNYIRMRIAYITHLPRTVSDHAPLLLTLTTQRRSGPRLFRFEQFWLDILGVNDIVLDAWRKPTVGSPLHCIARCLKEAKARLIRWNKTDVGISLNWQAKRLLT